MIKFLEFILENQNYAISVDNVRSVSQLHKIVRVPQAPNFVLGVTGYKGQITTVIDLKKLLEIPQISLENYKFAINVNIDNSFFALVVDNVLGVIDVNAHNIQKIKALDFNIVRLIK